MPVGRTSRESVLGAGLRDSRFHLLVGLAKVGTNLATEICASSASCSWMDRGSRPAFEQRLQRRAMNLSILRPRPSNRKRAITRGHGSDKDYAHESKQMN
jgi:hypothetical protein